MRHADLFAKLTKNRRFGILVRLASPTWPSPPPRITQRDEHEPAIRRDRYCVNAEGRRPGEEPDSPAEMLKCGYTAVQSSPQHRSISRTSMGSKSE
jgi:hypothetical protein